MNEDLSALVFELQRAGSKADKAKALARAWRTVRGLSKTERRLLAREVGFDGAEDLIEGLAGEGEGVFAPAAVLEALGKMRRGEGLSLRGILSDLRDPDRRDDLLVRGIDLVADSVARPEEIVDEHDETPIHGHGLEIGEGDFIADAEANTDEEDSVTMPPIPAGAPSPEPEPEPLPAPDPEPPPEPKPEIQPHEQESSLWDNIWEPVELPEQPTGSTAMVAEEMLSSGVTSHRAGRPNQTQGSTLGRLRSFRNGLDALRGAGIHRIREALEDLPEPWARRRALVALLEADIPDDPASALELIGDMERAMDRGWCLSALARRGDLTGAYLERALEMVSSPAARRRLRALARA